ncbi:cobalt ABC transporter permease [Thioclava dalianensis]|uniref:Cobalt ABC transporter permease n=1 Tax=Thioclava dalianensis TaxID=1185766 RepID=A0A074U083_9RHOB|nr:cobalt ECF transporter T component CbiQ [Thioclava dalianensis]KEP68102.1 cobalt ABC transporter permease [Thioclava dalianensis]SFN39192.1 cobalt/nickel transport system permease protein [Thioclava dalianensis]
MAHVLDPAQRALDDPCPPALIARRDPRLRIVLAGLFACVTVCLSDFAALGGALALAVLALTLSGLPPRRTLRRMAGMDGFILAMLILLPFSVPGSPLITVWGFTASREGLAQAVQIALRANAVILMAMAMVGSMEAARLGSALHALYLPERLVQLLMFTTRYIEVLREEYLRLRVSMRCRGFKPGTNLHSYRSFGHLLGMMLVRALERSERVLGAMKCRGFDGRLRVLDTYALSARDLVFGAIGVGLMLTLIGVQLRHGFA